MFKRPRAHKILTVCVPIFVVGLILQAPFTSGALASYVSSDNVYRQIQNMVNLAPAASAATTLGPWQETTPLLSVHADFGGLVGQSSDHVYIVSGCGPDNCMWGGASSDVEGAPISLSGDIGPWQQLNPLITGQGTPVVVVGNYLIAVGVARAAIKPDGSLGEWAPVSGPTTTGFRPAAAVAGNTIYVLGGFTGQAATSVERTIVNADGTLGPWQPVSNMVVGRMEFAAFVAGNYLYALGGEGPQPDGYWASMASIERSAIQPDGSLGAWEIIGSMPSARHNFAAVHTHGDLYVLGGFSTVPTCCHFLNTVDKATVNSDGTIGGWQAMAPMLTARASFAAVATDSYLYAIGGWGNITSWMEPLQSVERAPILEPGTISAAGDGWITSPAGAYSSKPSLKGKAQFEFSAKLKPGAPTPTGQTVFDFEAARLSFKSTSYDSLVVAGDKAQFKGSGKINGKGSYGFLVSAMDGQADGKQGRDKLRIKIWNKADGAVVYDNQPMAGDADDPTLALGGGSIVIRAKNPLPTQPPAPPTPTPNPYPYPYPPPPTPTTNPYPEPPTPTPNPYPYPYPPPPTATSVPPTPTMEPNGVEVSGVISVTTTWTNDHVYYVVNTVWVDYGGTLTIQPGTIVRFRQGQSLYVLGTLVAAGTEAEPIRFTSDQAVPTPGDWDRILFAQNSAPGTFDTNLNYTGGSILSYATIEYGNDVYLDNTSPMIVHNLIRYMGASSGLNGDAGVQEPLLVAYNTLPGTAASIGSDGGAIHIIGNEITGAGLFVMGTGEVVSNTVAGSGGVGIYAYFADLIGNRVLNCYEGILVNSTGLVEGNLIANNVWNGLRVLNSPTIRNNTIVGNGGTALVVDSLGPSIPHHNNLIAAPGQLALQNNTGSSIDATDNWWGTTNAAEIASMIGGWGPVTYEPFLSEPEPTAPIYTP